MGFLVPNKKQRFNLHEEKQNRIENNVRKKFPTFYDYHHFLLAQMGDRTGSHIAPPLA